jgi:RDD family
MAKENSVPASVAGFGSRFAAITVDWFACSLIVNGLTGRNYGYEGERLLLFFTEVVLLTTLMGSSAGQRLFRLKVIDSETGLALSPLRVLIRTALIILVLPALFRRNGIAYHDYICKSVVVRR